MKGSGEAPLVSIVTPSFNQAEYLESALLSVLNQDYPRIEYIVIDGMSTDGSREILAAYEDRLARLISEPDSGQADAINKGLHLAEGEIVAWLNSDDVYLPGAVKSAVAALSRFPEAGMVYGDGIMVDENLHILDYHPYPQVDLLSLLQFEVILQPAVFMRRSVVEKVGFLNLGYRYILDHELWIRIAANYELRHIGEWWALERSHARAKTTAEAGGFVQEAEDLIQWASIQPDLKGVVSENSDKIIAGLHSFCARREIDAARYSQAVVRMIRSLWYHPPTFIRYWYKFVQAAVSAIGLAFVFRAYRRLRRLVQHRGRRAALDLHLENHRSRNHPKQDEFNGA